MEALSSPDPDGPAGEVSLRAAQYVRMSTEPRRYSTENQADTIAQYAARYGFEIVRTYADNGKAWKLHRGNAPNWAARHRPQAGRRSGR